MPSVAVIGAGHNGLITAGYLLKAGFAVTIYEARATVGGLSATEELFPGVRSSSLANWYGMLQPEVLRDFDLTGKGLKTFIPPYTSIHMAGGGAICLAGNDQKDRRAAFLIRDLSDNDLDEWDRFWAELSIGSEILSEHLLDVEYTQEKFCQSLWDAGLTTLADAVFVDSLVDYAEKCINHPVLLAAVATMNFDHPCSPGSLYETLYLDTARAFGVRGKWGFVYGGMGRISELLATEAKAKGAMLVTSSKVNSIESRPNGCTVIAGQERKDFDFVVSTTDPLTLDRLLGINSRALSGFKPFGSKAAIHLRIGALPDIPAFQAIGRTGASRYQGGMDFSPTIEDYKTSYNQLQHGVFCPTGMALSSHIPSVWDPSIMSGGRGHLWTIIHHYVPPADAGASWNEHRDILLQETIAYLRQHVSNLDEIIEDSLVITPQDIQETYGNAAFSCAHLPMIPEYSLEKRFPAHVGSYRTEVDNVFSCGGGTFPNANVTGAPGYLCAKEIIQRVPIISGPNSLTI